MLREIAENLSLSEEDYFLEKGKTDPLVFSYLKKDEVSVVLTAIRKKKEKD